MLISLAIEFIKICSLLDSLILFFVVFPDLNSATFVYVSFSNFKYAFVCSNNLIKVSFLLARFNSIELAELLIFNCWELNLLGQLTNQIYKNIKNPITVKEPKTTRIQNEVFCDCVATALITSFCTLGLNRID